MSCSLIFSFICTLGHAIFIDILPECGSCHVHSYCAIHQVMPCSWLTLVSLTWLYIVPVTMLHKILWEAITYQCLKCLLLVLNSLYDASHNASRLFFLHRHHTVLCWCSTVHTDITPIFPQYSQKTPHISPLSMRCGVSFMSSKSDVLPSSISTGTRLQLFEYICCFRMNWWIAFFHLGC